MKITDGLLGEHALFYPLFDSVEAVMSEATSAIEVQRAFQAIGEAILTHANLEDELLFPSIAAHIPNGPISVMRAEHREIDALTANVTRTRTLEEAREIGRRLLDLLREHFHKEEAVLFPMAERHVGERVLLELGERWRSRRGL